MKLSALQGELKVRVDAAEVEGAPHSPVNVRAEVFVADSNLALLRDGAKLPQDCRVRARPAPSYLRCGQRNLSPPESGIDDTTHVASKVHDVKRRRQPARQVTDPHPLFGSIDEYVCPGDIEDYLGKNPVADPNFAQRG
jgi:hypothetical protein